MKIMIWDRAVRVTHLCYPILLIGLWLSAETRLMKLHVGLGITLCGLLIFRILWGFVGSNTARFTGFVKGPSASVNYVRNMSRKFSGQSSFGHNPIGGWSVIAMLSAMAFQVSTGLFSVDTDGLFSGALARFVSFRSGRDMADLHETGFLIIQVLVIIHLCAIIYYRALKQDKIIRPMITGTRSIDELPDGSNFVPANRFALLISIATALLITSALAWLQFG